MATYRVVCVNTEHPHRHITHVGSGMAERLRGLVQPILLVGAAVLVMLLAGCGGRGGVPSGSVATVGGSSIKAVDFNHWLAVTAQEDAAVIRHTSSDRKPVPVNVAVPTPPGYQRCIAALKGQPSSKGQTRGALKVDCEQQYESLKQRVLAFLVESQWLLREARARGIDAPSAAVQAQVDADIKQLYGTQARFRQFIARSEMSMEDFRFRARIQVLNRELESTVNLGGSVSEAQIRAYYRQHREKLQTPARRDILMVLAKTRGDAERAKKAVRSGTAWGVVAKKYSINPSPATLVVRTRAPLRPEPFERVVFAAKNGQLTGPVPTGFGFLIFRVTARRPASPLTLAEARDTIAGLVRSQQQGAAVQRFVNSYRQRYRSQTECAEGFLIPSLCKNAPKPTPSASSSRTDAAVNTVSR
jgi:foldase protein PrsA